MKIRLLTLSTFILVACLISSCEKYLPLDITGWSASTHGTGAANYTELFGQDQVHRIDLITSSKDWQLLINQTTRSYGKFGSDNSINEEIIGSYPIDYIPFTLNFNGKTWFKIGAKFKGNSSLEESWNKGSLKLPLRMQFDKFGNVYQGIDNQCFYGFRQMTFSNNALDPSQIREKLAYELMDKFNIPVPKTNFAEIYIDHGDGLNYHGLYTMTETIEDQMITRCFGGTKGNCYKPEGSAQLLKGEITNEGLGRKTNEWSTDISDITNFVDILHDASRTTNPEIWHNKLEKVFDVEGFLKWLAANTVMQNWDAYGISPQNFYLYHNPQNDKIVFIPWDVSESFTGGSETETHALDMSNITNEYPLIRFLMDDTHYYDKYKNNVKEFNENIFVPSEVNARIDQLFNLVQDKIFNEKTGYTIQNDQAAIIDYLIELKNFISTRHQEVELFY